MFNVAHNNEHDGNVVVYMRLKGMCRLQRHGRSRRASDVNPDL
jgi:hypothetical protein